jgi:hypothetical protein
LSWLPSIAQLAGVSLAKLTGSPEVDVALSATVVPFELST